MSRSDKDDKNSTAKKVLLALGLGTAADTVVEAIDEAADKAGQLVAGTAAKARLSTRVAMLAADPENFDRSSEAVEADLRAAWTIASQSLSPSEAVAGFIKEYNLTKAVSTLTKGAKDATRKVSSTFSNLADRARGSIDSDLENEDEWVGVSSADASVDSVRSRQPSPSPLSAVPGSRTRTPEKPSADASVDSVRSRQPSPSPLSAASDASFSGFAGGLPPTPHDEGRRSRSPVKLAVAVSDASFSKSAFLPPKSALGERSRSRTPEKLAAADASFSGFTDGLPPKHNEGRRRSSEKLVVAASDRSRLPSPLSAASAASSSELASRDSDSPIRSPVPRRSSAEDASQSAYLTAQLLNEKRRIFQKSSDDLEEARRMMSSLGHNVMPAPEDLSLQRPKSAPEVGENRSKKMVDQVKSAAAKEPSGDLLDAHKLANKRSREIMAAQKGGGWSPTRGR